jgi:serine/threonine-protein kinase
LLDKRQDIVEHKPIGAFGSKYELIDHIARGGMSDVYAARVIGIAGFERLVAIKRIRDDLALDRGMIELFLKEARLAGMLHHPNIAQVYDLGIIDGSYFLAMEYVEGVDVRWILRTAGERHAASPLGFVIAVGAGVCAGLHYLHEQVDVIHRDVSPSNVMVGCDGGVKLIDFGIALARSSRAARRGSGGGKPSYMSPEQCLGRPLDRRADLFAVGVLLWELTVLEKLFRGHDEADTMVRVVSEPAPPPSARRPDVPPALERIILRALAKRPSERYSTAEALRADLEEVAHQHRLNASSSAVALHVNELLAVAQPS